MLLGLGTFLCRIGWLCLFQVFDAEAPMSGCQVIKHERIIRKVFVVGEKLKLFQGTWQVRGLDFEEREGQSIVRGGNVLVVAELGEELTETSGREAIVLLVVSPAG